MTLWKQPAQPHWTTYRGQSVTPPSWIESFIVFLWREPRGKCPKCPERTLIGIFIHYQTAAWFEAVGSDQFVFVVCTLHCKLAVILFFVLAVFETFISRHFATVSILHSWLVQPVPTFGRCLMLWNPSPRPLAIAAPSMEDSSMWVMLYMYMFSDF